MVTTFQSRELVRDEIVALFVANGSWQDVYGYAPSVNAFRGRSPVLVILSSGTRQSFAGVWNNPTSYRFTISNHIVAGSETDATITSTLTEDEIDTLDKSIRQIIRDNVQLTNADNLRFSDEYSNIENIIIENIPYIKETYTIFADLPKGSK